MLSPELDLFSIDAVAKHRGVEREIVEKWLEAGKLFCTVKLAGEFLKSMAWLVDKEESEGCLTWEQSIGEDLIVKQERGKTESASCCFVNLPRSSDPRGNEFLVLDYSKLVLFDKDQNLNLEKPELKRFQDDGFIYRFREGDAERTRGAIYISREEVERFERENLVVETTEPKPAVTGGDLRSGKVFDARRLMMDDALTAFRAELNGESEDFDYFLKKYIKVGMGNKTKIAEYKVLSVNGDVVIKTHNKRRLPVSTKALKTIWKERKKKKPYLPAEKAS